MPKRSTDKSFDTAALLRGFTLIELILVMGIMTMLFLVAVPGIKSIINTNNLQGAARLVGSAVASARAQAPLSPPMDFATYQGSAIIFTPQHEIRFTRNREKDYHASNNEYVSDGSGDHFYSIAPPNGPKHGYLNIKGVDPLRWPDSVGVMGLTRGGAAPGYLKLLTPPFAIRFDPQGRMDTVGRSLSSIDRAVFYDGNYDFKYTLKDRSNPYGPTTNYNSDAWDPSREEAYLGNGTEDFDEDLPNIHPDTGLYKLPFERLETVIGVVVFDRAELDSFAEANSITSPLESNGTSLLSNAPGSPAISIRSWILGNGRVLFFNRYTGTVLDQDVE